MCGVKLVQAFFIYFSELTFQKIKNEAWNSAPMDAPRWELFIRGLGSIVVLLVFPIIVFLCVHTERLHNPAVCESTFLVGDDLLPGM